MRNSRFRRVVVLLLLIVVGGAGGWVFAGEHLTQWAKGLRRQVVLRMRLANVEPSEYFSPDMVRTYVSKIESREKLRRDGARPPKTEKPTGLNWANSVEEAIERATAEDKPIFVFQFVSENGDPACDV